jgi:nucleotide-binding universal stress UspA family protein
MQHLVTATDLSAIARRAVDRAALIASEVGASLDLLHVLDIAPLERLRAFVPEALDALQQRVLDAVLERLEEQARELSDRFHLQVETQVVTGSLPGALAEAPEVLAADLLICGASGQGHVRRPLLGSTAERMIGLTRCPMLVVKQIVRQPYGRLLIPIDFSPPSVRAIELARSVAPHADIVLLHVFEVPFEQHLRYADVDEHIIDRYRIDARQDALERMHGVARTAGLDLDAAACIVLQGYPSACIVEQERQMDRDLIVTGRRGANLLGNFLLGSVTKRVLEESQADVLISV